MINLNEFENMTNEECIDRYDWGYDGKPGTTAYHGTMGAFEVFANELPEGVNGNDNIFACELYDADGGMVAEGYAATFEDAIRAAFVMACGPDALEEGNSEDAVNACAFGAFEMMFERMPEHDEDMLEMDAILAHAVEYVRERAAGAGFEWEDVWA